MSIFAQLFVIHNTMGHRRRVWTKTCHVGACFPLEYLQASLLPVNPCQLF